MSSFLTVPRCDGITVQGNRIASALSAYTSILLVDDTAVMRRSLKQLLDAHDNWKVCDEASDGREALSKFSTDRFDVVVLDCSRVVPGLNSGNTGVRCAVQKRPNDAQQ